MDKETLRQEAHFQDNKIKGCSKRSEAVFYHGPAAAYRTSSIEDMMGNICGLKILDLGAGDGWNTMRMLEKGAYVYAVDISSESIQHINHKAAAYTEQNMYYGFVMDASKMIFDNNTFDIVVGHGILHHILNYEELIPEILRVLKPGGRAFFNEPLGINPFINLYRILTPKSRTVDERPLSYKDILLIKKIAPSLKCHFYEFLTLLSKPFILMKQYRFANKIEAVFLKTDRRLLSTKRKSVTFLQKMAWFVVLEFQK